MIRILDFTLSLTGLIASLPILLILLIAGFFDTGSPLFIQNRLGKDQRQFKLIKFRTMSIGTAQVATHLSDTSQITKLGAFLRKSKLDELPQLINVIKGEMSLVGPRPGLPTQLELTAERKCRQIFSIRPGITGYAQVNEIDMSTPKKLARCDQLLVKNLNVCWYFQLIIQTITGKGQGDRVKQD